MELVTSLLSLFVSFAQEPKDPGSNAAHRYCHLLEGEAIVHEGALTWHLLTRADQPCTFRRASMGGYLTQLSLLQLLLVLCSAPLYCTDLDDADQADSCLSLAVVEVREGCWWGAPALAQDELL